MPGGPSSNLGMPRHSMRAPLTGSEPCCFRLGIDSEVVKATALQKLRRDQEANGEEAPQPAKTPTAVVASPAVRLLLEYSWRMLLFSVQTILCHSAVSGCHG